MGPCGENKVLCSCHQEALRPGSGLPLSLLNEWLMLSALHISVSAKVLLHHLRTKRDFCAINIYGRLAKMTILVSCSREFPLFVWQLHVLYKSMYNLLFCLWLSRCVCWFLPAWLSNRVILDKLNKHTSTENKDNNNNNNNNFKEYN